MAFPELEVEQPTGEEEFESDTTSEADDLGEAAEHAVDAEGEPLGEEGEEPGAAPAKEVPWTPPAREEWDRLNQQRDAFRHEMVRHRTELKQLAERVQPFIDYAEKAAAIDAAIAKDEAERIPDPTEDGLGHVVGRIGAQIRPIAEAVSKLEAARLESEEQRMFEADQANLKAEADEDIAGAEQELPDWKPAMGHLAQTMMGPLLERLPEAEAKKVFSAELAAVVQQCRAKGVSPARHFYLMAQQLGYKGAPPNGNGAPRGRGKLTAQREATESMAGIAPLRGSSSSARLMPSAREMASMSTEDWAAAVDQYGLDKLMSALAEETGEA